MSELAPVTTEPLPTQRSAAKKASAIVNAVSGAAVPTKRTKPFPPTFPRKPFRRKPRSGRSGMRMRIEA